MMSLKDSTTILLTPRTWGSVMGKVLRFGDPVAPRGIPTHEIVGARAILRDPLDRVVTSQARKTNVAFGVAEFIAMTTGIDDIEFFKRFIKSYGDFSTDGKVLDGAYGTRMVYDAYPDGLYGNPVIRHEQLAEVERKLNDDPWTRQAVMAIYQREDLHGLGGVNTPCTLNLQFLNREGTLEMIVTMRSSDVVKGLTYDLFVFSLIQEYLARRLGLNLGRYIHNAGSLHIYDYDIPSIEHMDEGSRWPFLMDAMPYLEPQDLVLTAGITQEALDDPNSFGAILYSYQTRFSTPSARRWGAQMAGVMVSYAVRKTAPESSAAIFTFVKDRTIRTVLRQRLADSGVVV